MSVAQFDANKGVGARVRRREDPRFLQGKGSYVDDLQRAGMLQAAFVRADVAHGEIKSIDVEAARAVPGVVDVFTGQDLAEIVSPVVAQNELPGYQEHPMHVLPTDRVRYPGEPIAIVVAEDRYEAEDGADAVVVDVDPLPALSTIEAATAPGAPAIHEEIPDNLFNHFTVEHGDVKQAFADADFTIESELRSQRVAPVPLEPRAVMAEWDHTGSELSVWATHQAPHMFRTGLAEFLSIPEGRIRVVSPDVGGGFGTKMIVYAEDLAVAGVARLTQRAVRWTSDRREDLLSCMHSREQIHRIEAAVREDGRVLGVRIKIMASNGAHAIWPMTAGLDSGQASENVTGPYDIPNYERDVYAVVTNRTPMGPYRGVGRVSACFSIERTMDKIAQRLEIEPLEVRRRNVDPYVHADPELDPLGPHHLEPAVDHPLLELEIGNPVAQQPPDSVLLLVERHGMAGSVELGGGGEPRRTRADDRHALPRPKRGRLWNDPALAVAALGNRLLDQLDRDRIVVDPENTGRLAGRWTDAAGELRKVVRAMKTLECLAPLLPVHQVVEVGDDVPERAALLTERDAAVHAARALLPQQLLGGLLVDVEVVEDPFVRRPTRRHLAAVLDETGDLTHPRARSRTRCPQGCACSRSGRSARTAATCAPSSAEPRLRGRSPSDGGASR